ncbi:hypothetical protein L484_004140 [Morus notabilis]|uniref:Uncharacterized protein n=1 Tax=Morus notabilis TaxID=981085 RepID=W9SUE0_9ROSA|nr:hypothetical protein L484_004140 [Morus notabilis]
MPESAHENKEDADFSSEAYQEERSNEINVTFDESNIEAPLNHEDVGMTEIDSLVVELPIDLDDDQIQYELDTNEDSYEESDLADSTLSEFRKNRDVSEPNEKLCAIRELFSKPGVNIDAYIIPSQDAHQNQMVELRQQREDNNEVVDEVAICAQILGSERNWYIPGLGPITRKRSSQPSTQLEAQF